MRFHRLLTLGCVVAAAGTGVVACGGDDDSSGGGGGSSSDSGGGELHIYSSLPLEGASRGQATALVDGMKLALEQAGGKAGDYTVKYTSLSDASAQAGNWTPELTSANARKAAQDDKTAVYLGEFNSGASAVSIPILNEGGVPQISPCEHRGRPHLRRRRRGQGRAGQVLPGRNAHLHPHRAEGHDPGRRARDDHEGGRLHERRDGERQGGLRRRPGAQHRGRGQVARA